jgi:hypothetical protein
MAEGYGVAKSGKTRTGRKTGRDGWAGRLKGPCRTCNNAPDCAHRRRRGYDVVHCELYDGYAEPPARPVDDFPDVVERKMPETAETAPTGRLAGLCVNCGRAGGCNLPRPAGGVWHCQEYT